MGSTELQENSLDSTNIMDMNEMTRDSINLDATLDNTMISTVNIPIKNELEKPGNMTFLYKNNVVDLSGFIHPGGQWVLETIRKMELSRYIMGSEGVDIRGERPWNHSYLATNLLKTRKIGTIFNPESLDKWPLCINGSEKRCYSNEIWVIEKIKKNGIFTHRVDFKNSKFQLALDLKGISWISKSFLISVIIKARIYTCCLAFTKEQGKNRKSLLKFLENREETETEFIHKADSISLLMKKIETQDSLTSIMLSGARGADKYHIEGPYGLGLGLKSNFSGKIGIVCSGTGILPFMDLFDVLLKRQVYIKLSAEGRDASVVKPEQEYEEILKKAELQLFCSFATPDAFLGKEWIGKLVELTGSSGSRNGGLTKCEVRLPHEFSQEELEVDQSWPSNLELGHRYFDYEFFVLREFTAYDRVYVSGGPEFRLQVESALVEAGIPKNKIVIT